ncbi:MAG: hypothetical protein RI953_2455 [Pseudomonadota bacterium]|jgi:hypothetical protein
MKLFFWGYLSVCVFLASCTKGVFGPESQLNGNGATDDPYSEIPAPVDDNHYASDDIGRVITQNDDGTYNVRCNRGPNERSISSVVLDSGNYCIQEKNAADTGQPISSIDNPLDPSRYPASPGHFKKYQGRVVGKSFNNSDCSIEITPDSNGFVLLIKYKYMDVDYEETVHSSKFASHHRLNALTAARNGILSVSRKYNIGIDRNGNWLYVTSRAFSGGRLACMKLKRAAQ